LASEIKNFARNFARNFGFDLVKYSGEDHFPSDFDQLSKELILKVKPYTATSPERISALSEAVKYIVNCSVPGHIVECGVWKGGSMMAIAHTLLDLNDNQRHLYLYDTFEGMSSPTTQDVELT
jgi:hypothetical protein